MQPFRPPPQARSHSPATSQAPTSDANAHPVDDTLPDQARPLPDSDVRDYEQRRDRLGGVVDASIGIMADLRNLNRGDWPVRYPLAPGPNEAETSAAGAARPLNRRTFTAIPPAQSLITDTEDESSEAPHIPGSRKAMKRAVTGLNADASESDIDPHNRGRALDLLSIENVLQFRHSGHQIIADVGDKTMSNSLDRTFGEYLDHLAQLQRRIFDAHSRVLVTGDLNAGKSTLVNALTRRHELMPTDEQPLTTRFVEVISAKENGGKEEIHVPRDGYNAADPNTFDQVEADRLEELVADSTRAQDLPIRVYLREEPGDSINPSILHNDVVEISLIDAPGLNRDVIQTTANLARQEEIDVVVFVVSAANHFTLSAKEFILQAGQEKAHLFIVVNRFDQIKDRDRCRRLVMEQIKMLSPETYNEAADLVHFVDSAKVAYGFGPNENAGDLDEAFSHLEHSLRSFVLVNRAKSKLGPARHFVSRLLADAEIILAYNLDAATLSRDSALATISQVKPELEKMRKGKQRLEMDLISEEDGAIETVARRIRHDLTNALDRVGSGQLAVLGVDVPSWPGFGRLDQVWSYPAAVRRAFLASLDEAVKLSENHVRELTSERVEAVFALSDRYLPNEAPKTRQDFQPQHMYFRQGPGIHLARSGLVNPTLSDHFNYSAFLSLSRLAPNPSAQPSSALIPYGEASLGMASLAVTAFGFLNTSHKLFDLHSIIAQVVRFSDTLSSPAARRVLLPLVGLATAAGLGYVIYDLPRSIPRNVGANLRTALLTTSGAEGDEADTPFIEVHQTRARREVRLVMRALGGIVNDGYRQGLEERQTTVREAEAEERVARQAIDEMEDLRQRVELNRQDVSGVKI